MLSLSIHRAVSELREWDDAASVGGFYSSSGWLRVFESEAARYLAVRDDDRVVAVLPWTLARGNGELPFLTDPHFLFGRTGPVTPELAERLYPHATCGIVRGYTNRLLVAPSVAPGQRAEILRKLVDGARDLAVREGARTLGFGYLPPADARELAAVAPELVPVFAGAEAVLEGVTTLDAYLARLNANHRRNAKREMRGFADEGFRLEIRTLSEVFDRMCELSTEHENKFGWPTTVAEMRAHYQRWLDAGLDGATRVYCARRGDDMVGFALHVAHGTTLYGRDIGASRDAPKAAALYFNLAFYQPIVVGGIATIHFGLASLEAKIPRGCATKPLWTLLDGLGPPGALDGDLLAELRRAARTRLDGVAELARKYRDAEAVRAELELDAAHALLADPPA